MKKNHKLLLIFYLITICSCTHHELSHKSNKSLKIGDNFEGIAIILLNISNNEGNYLIKINRAEVFETTKKIDDNKNQKKKKNDFVCFVLDENKNVIDTLLIHQPLHPRFEYSQDGTTINSAVIEHPSADVFLRFVYLPKMKYLRIEKVEENNKLRFIDVLKMP